MKLIDGIKMKGRGVVIPDASRDDFPELFNQLGFHVGAEIGVATGEFSEILCKGGFRIFSVDSWSDHTDYSRKSFAGRLAREYEIAKERLKPYDNIIVKKISMEAVKEFRDESLDFVYIDAHHGFKYVTEDIYEWSKKVKKGGIISGHDYLLTKSAPDSPYANHVKYVVDSYTRAFGIQDWYIIGRWRADVGEKRDRCRSWFWFKL